MVKLTIQLTDAQIRQFMKNDHFKVLMVGEFAKLMNAGERFSFSDRYVAQKSDAELRRPFKKPKH